MSRVNDFEEDPPTVVARPMGEYKPDSPRVVLKVDPYESLRFILTTWAARNFHWLDENGLAFGVMLVTVVTWFLFQVMGAI